MNRNTLLWVLGGAVLVYVVLNRQQVGNIAQSAEDLVTATVSGWQNVQQGPVWVPVINQAENAAGIPPNLLARMAYQESSFRPGVIDGTQASTAGALGILQLMPQYFSTVQVPVPFSSADTVAQISQAAQQLASLYATFGDWGLAVAAYNDGAGNVNQYVAGTRALPAQTQDYVAAVLADVPLPSVLLA